MSENDDEQELPLSDGYENGHWSEAKIYKSFFLNEWKYKKKDKTKNQLMNEANVKEHATCIYMDENNAMLIRLKICSRGNNWKH